MLERVWTPGAALRVEAADSRRTRKYLSGIQSFVSSGRKTMALLLILLSGIVFVSACDAGRNIAAKASNTKHLIRLFVHKYQQASIRQTASIMSISCRAALAGQHHESFAHCMFPACPRSLSTAFCNIYSPFDEGCSHALGVWDFSLVSGTCMAMAYHNEELLVGRKSCSIQSGSTDVYRSAKV